MEIRPYRGKDEPELLNVWRASMTADTVSETLFRTKVLLDSNFTPDNLPVAIEDGRVVGFVLFVTRQVPLFLLGLEPEKAWISAFGVLPGYRGLGIASALLQYAHDRLAKQHRRTIEISPYVPNYFAPGIDVNVYRETIPFLEKAGYTIFEHAISMGVDLSGFQIPEALIELEHKREHEDGVTVRAVTSTDLPELLPFIVKHFGWDWFRHAQDYLLELFGGGNPDHICFVIARQHGTIVGYCQQRLERFGPFGVDPNYRNLGIGRLLLFRCLATMSARQTYFAYFMWTGEDAARLYSVAGFKPRREFVLMRKTLA